MRPHARIPARDRRRGVMKDMPLRAEETDTIPGTPFIESTPPRPDPLRELYDDADFRTLYTYVHEQKRFLEDKAWDNLAHVERFARAARFIAKGIALEAPPSTLPTPVTASSPPRQLTLLERFTHAQQRRAMTHLLWMLLPVSSRKTPHLPLPQDIARRADNGFALQYGDVPCISQAFSAFLGRDDVLPRAIRPGVMLLAPRHACPGAAKGTCVAVVVDNIANDVARVHVPAGIVGNAERIDVRLGPDGKPLRAVDGRMEPITLALDQLAAWLLGAGPDARGLDLRSVDDRSLLLVWSQLLRERVVEGKTVFQWLETTREDTPRAIRIAVVDEAIRAAIDAVSTFTIDPVDTRFVFRVEENDGGWTQRAAAWLDDVGLFRDIFPASGLAPGQREMVWADAFLVDGYAAGRLSSVSAGRAFARLATSVLAPLGVLPLSGLKDGSGAVVLQRLLPDDDDGNIIIAPPRIVSFEMGARDALLFDAWKDSFGTALPEPKGNPRHDVQQMPAWLAFFLEAVGENAS
jgi:hypothetical protein